MKFLRDKGSLGLVLGIMVAVAVAVFQSIGWERVLPLVAVAILALVFLNLIANAEDRLTRELQSRLPQISYIEKREEVELAMCRLAERASEFIVTSGGKSRNIQYLRTIEQKSFEGQIFYWRILYDKDITEELYNHLSRVISLPNVTIVHVGDDSYNNMTLADTGAILALPVPGHGELKAIEIPSPEYSRQLYTGYMMSVFSKAFRIDTLDDLNSFLDNIQEVTAQQDAPTGD